MASGGERGASVSGDGNHSGRASGGGSSAPACFESAARATGSAHPGLCRSHGNGAARWPCLFHAAGGDQHAGDVVLVCTTSAHRGRALRSGTSAKVCGPGELLVTGTPRRHGGGGIGKRGKRYLKRQQLLELGEPAIRYLTEIVHRRP